MSALIKFRLNWQKAIEAIVWLACQRPGIGFFHIVKVLYYADKAHFQRHARPVLGDTYIAMEHGPLPSGVHDLLTKDTFLDSDLLGRISDAVIVEREPVPSVKARREPDLGLFSKSDLRCLQEALDQYGSMPLRQLRELTHRERAWVQAPRNGAMDYALMIDDDVPDRDKLIEEIRETAAYVVL